MSSLVLLRITVVVALLAPAVSLGWGFNGHRRLASKLHEPLPNGCLRSFLQAQAQTAAFQDDACDPDRWRVEGSVNYDPNEWPRHFLNIDYAQPIESYPRDWAQVEARFGQYAVQNGQVPFRVEEMYAILVARFQAGNAADIAQQVAWMSHYVTDAFSPYHDTRYSDPKLNSTDTVGGHSRYESRMLQESTYIAAISAAANTHFGTVGRADPKHRIFDIIIVGNPLAAQVAQVDLQGQGDLAALYNGTRDLTARRWGDALTLLSSLVVSAWVDAGRPLITGMPTGCSNVAPQGELVLKGFALPVFSEDGGLQDAGTGVDAGADASPAFGGGAGGGPPQEAAQGCGCGSAAGAWLLPFLLVLGHRRRRL